MNTFHLARFVDGSGFIFVVRSDDGSEVRYSPTDDVDSLEDGPVPLPEEAARAWFESDEPLWGPDTELDLVPFYDKEIEIVETTDRFDDLDDLDD